MAAVILDGKKVRDEILERLKPRIEALRTKSRPPGLAVVLVGDNPASQIYVRNKVKASEELGIRSFKSTPPASITTEELLAIVDKFNRDPEVDGILIQTPLPKQVDTAKIFLAVDPKKDADGFHPYNVGNLVANRPAPRSCTPAGIMELLKQYNFSFPGKRAVVVGRSETVGKPMALLLLNESATVTICHSRTVDLAEECRRADLLVAAIGRPAIITADYIKPGAVVVDVGINRIQDAVEVERLFGHDPARLASFAKTGSALVGDVDPRAMQELASAYTPVPGGVGPLTIAMLMANTVELAEQHAQC
jgi:methylenetetrahydrofolate dehydrogenase (NADP+) / methenyltetrahydrofolate cyclohydrolase